jgi:uncharacterized membrane protein
MPSNKREKSKKKKNLHKPSEIIKEFKESPPDVKKEVSRSPEVIKSVLETFSFSGPLPPPEVLEKYGDINKSFPERIIKMAEKEQKNRHLNNKKELELLRYRLETERKDILRGQMFGFIIGLSVVIGGVLCAIFVNPWIGGAIATTGVASLVSVFIIGRSGQKDKTPKKKE